MNTPPFEPASVIAVTSADVSCLPAYICPPPDGAELATGEGTSCPFVGAACTGDVATVPPSISALTATRTPALY